MALPPISIRGDLGVLSTAAARYAPSLFKSFIQMGPQGALGATKLLRPFSEIVDSLELKDPFVRNWVDLLCFLLAGVKSDGTLSAEIVSSNNVCHLFRSSSLLFSSYYLLACHQRVLLFLIHNGFNILNSTINGHKAEVQELQDHKENIHEHLLLNLTAIIILHSICD